jgi:hypothetical protein
LLAVAANVDGRSAAVFDRSPVDAVVKSLEIAVRLQAASSKVRSTRNVSLAGQQDERPAPVLKSQDSSLGGNERTCSQSPWSLPEAHASEQGPPVQRHHAFPKTLNPMKASDRILKPGLY